MYVARPGPQKIHLHPPTLLYSTNRISITFIFLFGKTTMIDQDIFRRGSNALIRWFLQNPLAKINPKVELADLRYRGAGRGLGMFIFLSFLAQTTQS